MEKNVAFRLSFFCDQHLIRLDLFTKLKTYFVYFLSPFVFPFECRHLLFYVVSFDRDRALQRLLEAGGERGAAGANAGADAERVAPRLDRRKRTVQRHNVLRQAEHVMHEFAHSKVQSRAQLWS